MTSRLAFRLAFIACAAIGCCQPAFVRAEDDDLQATIQRLDELEDQLQQLQSSQISNLSTGGCGDIPRILTERCEVCPTWEASVEVLYLKTHQRGLDFAVTEDGTALTFGNADVHNLDYDRDGAFRTTLGYRTRTNWAIKFGYTSLVTDGLAFAERPDGIGQLFATRSQPDGAQEADFARAASTFDYQLFDIYADRPVYQHPYAQLSVFAGLRWIDMNQIFRYDYNGRDFTDGRIIDRTSMDGIGLRLGTEGSWKLAGGFSLFGSLAGGVAYGRYETRLFEDNLTGTILITDLRDQYEQTIPSLESRLGVGWTRDWLSVRVGYEMVNWFNLSDRASFTDDIQEATYVPLSQDVLLEGLFVEFGVIY